MINFCIYPLKKEFLINRNQNTINFDFDLSKILFLMETYDFNDVKEDKNRFSISLINGNFPLEKILEEGFLTKIIKSEFFKKENEITNKYINVIFSKKEIDLNKKIIELTFQRNYLSEEIFLHILKKENPLTYNFLFSNEIITFSFLGNDFKIIPLKENLKFEKLFLKIKNKEGMY